jgi:hypothetical protein
MSGAIPPLPNKPSWRGAQLKHRDNFTFTFFFTKTPEEKSPDELNMVNGRAREWAPLFLFNNQGSPCTERHEHEGKSVMVLHVAGKLFPQ